MIASSTKNQTLKDETSYVDSIKNSPRVVLSNYFSCDVTSPASAVCNVYIPGCAVRLPDVLTSA